MSEPHVFPSFESMTWGEREDHLIDEHLWDPVSAGRGDPDEHAADHRADPEPEHTHTSGEIDRPEDGTRDA